MSVTPTAVLPVWFLGLAALGLLGGGGLLLLEWFRRSWVYDLDVGRWMFSPDFGLNEVTALLLVGLACWVWSFAGRRITSGCGAGWARLRNRAWVDDDAPNHTREGVAHRLARPDGGTTHAETYGPDGAPPIVLIHGWGADGTVWYYQKRALAGRFRLVVWDLPGLGLSDPPPGDDYSLEWYARDLDAVLRRCCGGRPAVVVGHCMGAMIALTHARLFPDAAGDRVAGLVLAHGTYTNPIRTTQAAPLFTKIQGPVIVPLMRLMIALAPLVQLMYYLGHLNGLTHLGAWQSGFARGATWDRVSFAAEFQTKAWPAVLARGMLGMLAFDESATLASIRMPVLVLSGDQDPVCTPEASRHMNRALPDSRSIVFAPAKHMSLLQHHASFTEAVGDFASACLGPAPARAESGTAG